MSTQRKEQYYVANIATGTIYRPGHTTIEAAYRDAQKRYPDAKGQITILEAVAEIAPVMMIQRTDGGFHIISPDGTLYEPTPVAALPAPRTGETNPLRDIEP